MPKISKINKINKTKGTFTSSSLFGTGRPGSALIPAGKNGTPTVMLPKLKLEASQSFAWCLQAVDESPIIAARCAPGSWGIRRGGV